MRFELLQRTYTNRLNPVPNSPAVYDLGSPTLLYQVHQILHMVGEALSFPENHFIYAILHTVKP